MKFFFLLTLTSASPSLREDNCYWSAGHSGQFIECLPDFYIKGACESGSSNDCKVLLTKKDSFGVKCCPVTEELNFGNTQGCKWLGGNSGDKVNLLKPSSVTK